MVISVCTFLVLGEVELDERLCLEFLLRNTYISYK